MRIDRVFATAGAAEAVASPVVDRQRWVRPSRAPVAEAAITRWTFFLYVAWIPMEYPDRTLPFDLGTLMGAIFLATTLLSARACYARIPGPVILFGIFLYVWVASFVLNGGQHPTLVRDAFLRLVQLVLVLWASSNLLRDPRTARTALLVLVASCSVLALLQLTGVADAMGSYAEGMRRATVLGQNPNRTGRFYAGAALVVAGLAFTGWRPARGLRLLACALVGLFVVVLVQGGSRGAMLTLPAAMMAFALATRGFGPRVRNTVLASLVMGALGWTALQSPLMQKRLALMESGNLAGRETIFPTAWGMFQERPLLGWGPIRAYFELGSRLPIPTERRDTHNLVLELLTSAGVLGAVPALLAIGMCVHFAWRGRRGALGVLPLALLVQLLVGNMSGNFLAFKLYWLFLALAIAAEATPAIGTRAQATLAAAPLPVARHGRSPRRT